MSVPKSAPLPVYDAEKDGNPFFWIIETAKQVRDSREPIRRLGVPNNKKSVLPGIKNLTGENK